MDTQNMPPELTNIISEESPDFIVKAEHEVPVKQSVFTIIGGLFILGFISIFIIIFFGPVIMGQEVHFTANNQSVVAGPNNLGPLVLPGLVIGIFVLVGMGILIFGIYRLVAEGPWYAGTPTRLIVYKKNETKTIDWEQFTGNIDVQGSQEKGSIKMTLRSGHMESQKRGPDVFVPDIIYIAGIQNAFQIEQFLRKRIQVSHSNPSTINQV